MKTSLADLNQTDHLGLPPRVEEPDPPSLEARLAEAERVLREIASPKLYAGHNQLGHDASFCYFCNDQAPIHAPDCPTRLARAYFAAQGGTVKP